MQLIKYRLVHVLKDPLKRRRYLNFYVNEKVSLISVVVENSLDSIKFSTQDKKKLNITTSLLRYDH